MVSNLWSWLLFETFQTCFCPELAKSICSAFILIMNIFYLVSNSVKCILCRMTYNIITIITIIIVCTKWIIGNVPLQNFCTKLKKNTYFISIMYLRTTKTLRTRLWWRKEIITQPPADISNQSRPSLKYIYRLGKPQQSKFEMFQTIISFINLIPHVFKVAYVHHITLKSRYNLLNATFRYVCLNIFCLKGCFKTYFYICHICLTSEVKVVKR